MKKSYLLLISLFFILLTPHTALAYFDLKAGAITVSPTEPAQNEPCTITVRVTNQSDVDLTDYTGLSASDVTTNFKNFSITKTTLPDLPIAVDKTVTYKYEGSFSDVGRQSLYFRVNVNNTLSESTTGNNYSQEYVETVEPYDYQIDSIKLYPPNPIVGEDAIIEIKAKNNGFISFKTNQDISSVSYVFPNFEIDETVWPELSYDDKIENGEYYYYRYYGKFTKAGKIDLSYTLDSGDKVEEKSENNNYVSKNVEIFSPSDMDLEIYDIDFDIEKPLVDEEVEITVKVKNNGKASLIDERGISTTGNASAIPKIDKGFFADLGDINLVRESHDDYPTLENSLDPGDTFTYTYLGKFHFEGEKKLTFTVNQKQQLTEADYTDNASSTKITIYKNEEARDKFKILNYNVKFKDSETVQVSWNTDQKSTGEAWYKKKGFTSFVGQTLSSSEKTNHSITFNDLAPGTLYEFTIIAKNGTEEETLKDVFFTTPANNDVLLTKTPNTETDNNNVTINWSTNLISYSQIYYRILGDSSYQSRSVDTLTDAHSVTLTNLKDGTYEYYIKSFSNVKTESSSDVSTFSIKTTTETQTQTEEQTQTETQTQTEEQTQTTTQTQTQNSEPISITNQNLYNNLKGKIILTVEANGEAYYINPKTQTMNYLGRPDDAFSVMRSEGVGITTANLEQIQIGLTETSGPDSDGDGLSDLLEDAIGTNKNNKDTDGDGFDDKTEVANGANPNKGNNTKYPISSTFSKAQSGKIFLQVEGNGEAWYINPADNKRYFLGRPADAFAVMRNLGLGISNSNFDSLN